MMEMDPYMIGSAVAGILLILLAHWWINSPSRRIDRYIDQIRTGEMPDPPSRTDWKSAIALNAGGFTLDPLTDSSAPPISVQWESVAAATAFKRDLFSTDRVCIEFRLIPGSCVEVHEEMKGWSEFCDALPAHLPGAPAWTDWFMEITTPAFALNPTLLFPRESRPV